MTPNTYKAMRAIARELAEALQDDDKDLAVTILRNNPEFQRYLGITILEWNRG